jgi:peptidoglycan hydrolase FlgJ
MLPINNTSLIPTSGVVSLAPKDISTKGASVKDTYLDQNSLNSVKALGRKNDPQALKEIAKKFEAMFVQQMLKSMRDANAVFSEGDMFSSDEEKFHQEMLDQQMVLNLTSGKGVGLAKSMYEQMQRAYGNLNPEGATDVRVIQDPLIMPYKKTISSKAEITRSTTERTPQEFIAEMKPFADKAAKQLNVNSDVLLAQAALETGWGKNILHDLNGNNSFNIFNIKKGASWEGKSLGVDSVEYTQNVAEKKRADFRQYDNYGQGFSDYIALIKSNPRYQKVLESGMDSGNYAEALQKSGYATDPDYAEKIKSLLNHDAIRSASSDETLTTLVSEVTRG